MFLFVYGTLKRGGRLHSHNMKGATFVGQDRIAGVDLFRIQWYPAAKLGSGTLHGEVYEINDEILARMDQVEGEGTLYKRKQLTTVGGYQSWVYLYLDSVDPSRKIESGNFNVTTTEDD